MRLSESSNNSDDALLHLVSLVSLRAMTTVPKIKVPQPCHGVDLFYILPTVLVGSYPSEKSSIGTTSSKSSLNKILRFLAQTYKKSVVINLVAEQEPYHIDEEYSGSVTTRWIHWTDHHAVALSDFVSLIYCIARFLQDKSHGVFIHCKHGKGRTGTLVSALITLLYGVPLAEATQIFVQRRAIYDIGVKIKSQVQLLRYWCELLDDQKLSKLYTQIRINSKTWYLRKVRVDSPTYKYDSKTFDVRVANIQEDSTDSRLYFTNLDKLKVNQEYQYCQEIQENVCIEVEYSNIITRSFVTFSFNSAIEAAYQCIDQGSLLEISTSWKKMDGIDGTDFKGKRYFDNVSIWVQQISK